MWAARIATRAALAALVAAVLFPAGSARAQVGSTLRADLDALVERVGMASAAALSQDTAAASASLADARGLLPQLVTLARDPAAVQELGPLARRLAGRLGALQRVLERAQAALDSPVTRASRRMRVLRVAYSGSMRVAALAGKPILVETNSRTAGFHHPGDQVTFRVLGPDGAPCTEPPTLVVENQFGATAVDVSSVHQLADGTIALTMGDEAGGARVTVTACGRSSTRLLFNYGPKAVNGLPAGFPANLPMGTYALSYAASGVVSIPETPLATLPNLGVHAFARVVVTTFQQVAAAYASPECSIVVRYSPFDGSSFTATFSVTCTVDGASASETIIFRVRRI